MSLPLVIGFDGKSFSVLRSAEDWGIETFDLATPPQRFWSDQVAAPSSVEVNIDRRRTKSLPSPASLLQSIPEADNWQAQSKRSIARLWSYYLVCEDPQRRLDARPVATLAHQLSLVQYLLESDRLRRVLVADEVGLGKTVEVGLLIAELLKTAPGLKVLYLAPARLVDNVAREFDRLDLEFRRWKSGDQDARLSDPRIIASIHKAVHPNNFDAIIGSGPWDIIVVDECHHLSAWSPGGGDPVEKFRLVRELVARQNESSRLVLLSGTPHQGHSTRFENILHLLQWPSAKHADIAGRVIYRTKDDIRDWRGNPLFPPRQVNEPIVLPLSPRYREWLESIHAFYTQPFGRIGGDAKRRAAGWRCAQALQWAASSPQAGLGYLVRQAIRAGWTLNDQPLVTALANLRPYRFGSADEEVASLFERLVQEISRQIITDDLADIEEEERERFGQSPNEREAMGSLLLDGAQLVTESGDEKWRVLKERVLDPAGADKVVMFAQPVETVISLCRYLERTTGERPAMIIGGQSDEERNAEEEQFRNPRGPRFLVSSRAGGEGINLQVANRLVHVDVPWNPMELEQRVGRVHRFGSRRTIIVDTLVVPDSRETDAYRIARQKLRTIATTLRPQQFELVFSRVMSLVPPEELQNILIEGALSPLSPSEEAGLSEMVERGFREWQRFHDRFGVEQQRIRDLNPGLVTWDDVEDFLSRFVGAEPREGFYAPRFAARTSSEQSGDDSVNVFRLPDGKSYATGDVQGTPVFGPGEERVEELGLNSPPVADALRRHAFPKLWCGAAHLRLNSDSSTSDKQPHALLAFLVQPLRSEAQTGWSQLPAKLQIFRHDSGGESREIEGAEKRILLRKLMNATVRAKPENNEELLASVAKAEAELFNELRRPSAEEMDTGIRHAVMPLFCATIAIETSAR